VSLHITEDCINCGSCEEACPTEAISEDAAAGRRVIDPERCTECVGFYDRVMCNVECPVECCVPDPEREEGIPTLLARARALLPDHEFQDPPPARKG